MRCVHLQYFKNPSIYCQLSRSLLRASQGAWWFDWVETEIRLGFGSFVFCTESDFGERTDGFEYVMGTSGLFALSHNNLKYSMKQFNTAITDASRLANLVDPRFLGPLLEEMVSNMKKKSENRLIPDRKMFVYSGHDTTVANFLNTLGVFDPQCPPYDALVLIELRQNSAGKYFVSTSTVYESFYHNRDKLLLLTRNFVALSPNDTMESLDLGQPLSQGQHAALAQPATSALAKYNRLTEGVSTPASNEARPRVRPAKKMERRVPLPPSPSLENSLGPSRIYPPPLVDNGNTRVTGYTIPLGIGTFRVSEVTREPQTKDHVTEIPDLNSQSQKLCLPLRLRTAPLRHTPKGVGVTTGSRRTENHLDQPPRARALQMDSFSRENIRLKL
uniref:acid phosphatase n=1 Tax=Timema douglasi TaxID=61478 RepID=A0A7R8VCK5_TIMDO|nr:unnamed protein product [Timema douglasi]